MKYTWILDLDNTLWGGVIGEVGVESIHLGPTPEGRSFMEFQQCLLSLYKRGVILAINSKNNFDDAKIDIMYLGPAWDDWSNDTNSIYAALTGLTLRPNDLHITGDISGASMLDEEFTNINMMIKFYKFGFGRATDICNERIRNNKITRQEAIKLIEKYDGVCDDSIIKKYCIYVGISFEEFWNVTNNFVNQNIFFTKDGKRPEKKFKVGSDFDY